MKYAPPIGSADPNAGYVDRSGNTPGSPVPAAAIEPTMREIENVITKAGLTPDGNDLTQLWQAIASLTRIPVMGDLTLYVRTDGNDANSGTADTPQGACRTITGALSKMRNYYGNDYQCKIAIGTGTFTEYVTLKDARFYGFSGLTISGAGKDITIIKPAVANSWVFTSNTGACTIKNMTVYPPANASGAFNFGSGSATTVTDIKLVGSSTDCIGFVGYCQFGLVASNVTVSGTFRNVFSVASGWVNLYGTWNVSGAHTAFLQIGLGCTLGTTATFSGSMNGVCYRAWGNAVIDTGGRPANYFPGDPAGNVLSTGALYI